MPTATPLGAELSCREARERVLSAWRRLRDIDGFLLRHAANERSITHRLAMYLEPHFPGYDVDVEYNREGKEGDPKRLNWEAISAGADASQLIRDTEARTIFPDIIVHERGEPINLLVVEVKKSTSTRSTAVDRQKLAGLGDESGLGYAHAIFLEIEVGEAYRSKPTVDCVACRREVVR